MESWRGIALNDLIRILKSETWVFLPVMKERAKRKGVNISYGSIAEFLANRDVEGYILSNLKREVNE